MKIKPSIITVRQAQKEDKPGIPKVVYWILLTMFLVAFKDAVDIVIK